MVEDVTLRITRLRDLGGVVWYVRNGEICGWPTSRRDGPGPPSTFLSPTTRTSTRSAARSKAVAEDMYGDPLYDDMLLGRPTYAGVERRSAGRRCSSRSSPKPHRRNRSHSPGRSGRRSGRFRPRGYPGADGRATLPARRRGATAGPVETTVPTLMNARGRRLAWAHEHALRTVRWRAVLHRPGRRLLPGSGPGSRIAPHVPRAGTSVPLSAGCGCFWNSTGRAENLLGRTWAPKLRMRHARSKSPTTTVTSGSSTCARRLGQPRAPGRAGPRHGTTWSWPRSRWSTSQPPRSEGMLLDPPG